MIDITDYSSVNMKNYSLPKRNYKAYFELIAKNNSQVSENNGNLYLYFRNRAVSIEGNPSISYTDFSRLINSNLGVSVKDMEITEDTLVSYIWIATGVVLDNFKFRFAIFSENETDLTYVKHQEDNYILPIQQEMLKGDYFIKEADGWKEVHYIPKLRLLNQNFQKSSKTEVNRYYVANIVNISADRNSVNVLSEHFLGITATQNDNNELGISNYNDNGFLINIDKADTNFDTLGKFETFLQNNEVYAYYKTTTPTKLTCTEGQSAILDKLNNLDLFDGTNNIITTEDIALLKLKYVVDTKTYVDKEISDIKEQINTINELLSTTGTSSLLLDNLQSDLESEVM